MGRKPTPKLLPLLRSCQQGEILARLLGDPELEASVTDIAAMVGVPISSAHREIERAQSAGIEVAYIYGSWADRWSGAQGDRPVGDIDTLVLGAPDRDSLYAALSGAEEQLGRPVQVTVIADSS